MNNVYAVVLRTASSCLRQSPWPRPLNILSRAVGLSRNLSTGGCAIHTSTCLSPGLSHANRRVSKLLTSTQSAPARSYHPTLAHQALRLPKKTEVEQGLEFRDRPLSSEELRDVFGEVCPPQQFANRLLRVLHARRVDGCLDLPLPSEIERILKKYPYARDSALQWLRSKYYVDEDEAILARLDREDAMIESDAPSKLVQRGQNIGLYGTQDSRSVQNNMDDQDMKVEEPSYYGPQSGQYRAALSEKEGDVFGRSQLDRIRSENEAKAVVEEEELEKQIAQIQEKEVEQRSQDTALASRPDQGVQAAAENEVRPPNEFEKWILRAKNRSTSKLSIDSPEIQERSRASRLIPSLAFVIAGCAVLYAFAETWIPPKRKDRLWPDMTLSFATVAGILCANVGVWLLWKFPPAWPLLNRYFNVVPATLRPLSLLGNIFSHIGFRHLLVNAVPLLVFGPSLHEDLGRGHFLALYIGSGLLGAYFSMARYVSQGILITSALGASGCTWGVTGGFLNLHANDKFTIFFLPEDMKDDFSIKGWMFFAGLIAFEVVGVLTGKLKRNNVDYVAHFTGAIVGWLYANTWKTREAASQKDGQFTLKPSQPWWQFLRPNSGVGPSKGI